MVDLPDCHRIGNGESRIRYRFSPVIKVKEHVPTDFVIFMTTQDHSSKFIGRRSKDITTNYN